MIRLRMVILTGLVLLSAIAWGGPETVSATSANISRSYHANTNIVNGSIVSLQANKTDFIEPSNSVNGSKLLGVVTANNGSILAIDQGSTTTQVAISGTVNTLVSTLDGAIAVGDQIAVSPFNGVGMKAKSGSHVIGIAQTAFNANSRGATEQEIPDNTGKKHSLAVGYISLNIGIGTGSESASGMKLNALQKLALSITGHTVSTIRIIFSLIVAVAATIILCTLVYAAIYSSIISIGRNPLAKYAVFRTLGSVMVMTLSTAVIASLIIYFLLN